MRRGTLALLVLLVGCAGPRLVPARTPELTALWSALGAEPDETDGSGGLMSADACNAAFGTYFSHFGLRGLACTAAAAEPLGAVATAAGVPVFVSGPHAPGPAGLGLDLTSIRTFGHYNPAFVAWAVENGIPGEGNAAARMATQGVYDAHLSRLARVYWLVYGGLAADGYPARVPVGPLKDYQVFLRGGPAGAGADEYNPGFSPYAFDARSERIPGALGIPASDMDYYSALYEANTAAGFWLRRAEDDTQAAFHDGLRRLLTTYDAAWLAAHPA